MRLNYNSNNREFAIYVDKDEFNLAMDNKEFKVFSRAMDEENFYKLVKEFADFFKDSLMQVFPNKKIHDIIAFCSSSDGMHNWIGINNPTESESHYNLLEAALSYAVFILENYCQNTKNNGLLETLSAEDGAKLSLILSLISLINVPNPFVQSKKKHSIASKLKKINGKLQLFEERFGFTSETMWKYYQDDNLPDEEMEDWIALYEEKRFLINVKDKERFIKEMIDKWIKEF